jgi:zinc protease
MASILDTIAQTVLPNGMKVICLRKADAPVVAVHVWYRTGSAQEQPGMRGISHFLEHMMFRGSQRFGPEEHARKVNDAGGHCNAFTAEDVTAFVNAAPGACLDMVLELEADRMRGLTLDSTILEIERKVIVEEYHTYLNNPVTKAFLEFRTEFFGDHPYALSPLGSLDDINNITPDMCRSYFQQWYCPSNATCVVVGDFVSEKAVFESVNRHFGGIDAGSRTRAEVAAPSGRSVAQRMERRVEFDVPLMVLGFPAPASSHTDALALEILQLVVSQGDTSRMHAELVRKRSLAVMVGGMNHYLRSAGISLFFAFFTPDVSAWRLEKALDEQLSHVRDNGITADEMEKVKAATLTNRVFEMYSVENLAQRIGFSEAMEGGYGHWVSRLDMLEKLSIDQVVNVARRYWSCENKHVLTLRPKRVSPAALAAGLLRRALPVRRQ